jgi:hypothetical protein
MCVLKEEKCTPKAAELSPFVCGAVSGILGSLAEIIPPSNYASVVGRLFLAKLNNQLISQKCADSQCIFCFQLKKGRTKEASYSFNSRI